jgi:hypothetical protein
VILSAPVVHLHAHWRLVCLDVTTRQGCVATFVVSGAGSLKRLK